MKWSKGVGGGGGGGEEEGVKLCIEITVWVNHLKGSSWNM